MDIIFTEVYDHSNNSSTFLFNALMKKTSFHCIVHNFEYVLTLNSCIINRIAYNTMK